MRVSDQPARLELAEHWIAAAIEAGLPANDDFNDGQQEGAGPFPEHDQRPRGAGAPRRLICARRAAAHNLTRRDQGAGDADRLSRTAGRPGSSIVSGGARRTARARGEVIVCGGVFNSPQLLQLSGLGPGELLREFGIPVVRDMPAVGADLQDHFYVRLAFRCTKPITLNDVANNPLRKVTAGMQYLLFRTGPLATNGICAGGFARSDQRLERPDIQLNFSLWSFAERTRTGVKPHPFPGFTVSAVHLRPERAARSG